MASPTIRFRVDFQLTNSPKDLKITDVSDYDGLTVADMRCVLWVVDGGGTTIYKNGGYDSNDFSSPDIDQTPAYKDGIILQVDASGNPVTGTYTFYMKCQDVGGGTVYSGSNTYDYAYVTPSIDINLSYSCRTSELTSTDATDYVVESVTPSKTIEHTITKPSGSGQTDPGTTGDVSRTIGGGSLPTTRIWTGTYTTAITTTVLDYTMETWAGNTYIVISDEVAGSESIDVTCQDCINELQTCLTALYNRWKTAKEENLVEATRLNNVILEILTILQEYYDAERNGGDTDTFAGEIAELLSDEGFSCTTSSSTTSVVVVPWGEGAASVTGASISFVTAVPTGGDSGDLAIGAVGSSVEWNVYFNNGGTWAYQGNIKDASNSLIHSDFSDSASSSTVSEEILKTDTLAAGALSSAGGYFDIRAIMQINSPSALGLELMLYFGATKVCAMVTTNSINGYYELNARVIMVDGTNQNYESWRINHGTPSQIMGYTIGVASETLAGTIVVNVRSQKTTAGIIGDIVCKDLKIIVTQ